MNDDENRWTEYPQTPMAVETKMSSKELARRGALWIAILTLAVAVIMLIVTVNQVIGVWFKHQYAPLARFLVSIVLAGGALTAIWALSKREA